jgi:hypothetical protein
MYIIGVDYHPSFQQIAFLDQETGECGDRRLNHSDGATLNSANNETTMKMFKVIFRVFLGGIAKGDECD